ncbi:MAG: hypothetical protein J6C97_01175 [Clostridia bacterium]|nr:hypothetical protein [Clostridia bacterium]
MFIGKLNKKFESIILADGGYREKEAVKKCYCRTPLPNNKGVKFHYWKTDYRGNKERATATYVFGKGWK